MRASNFALGLKWLCTPEITGFYTAFYDASSLMGTVNNMNGKQLGAKATIIASKTTGM